MAHTPAHVAWLDHVEICFSTARRPPPAASGVRPPAKGPRT
ncbi:hypothetical protein ACF053_25010 [Streptomyces kanasensis]